MSDQVENHDNDDASVVVSSSVPEKDINVSEKDSNYLQLDVSILFFCKTFSILFCGFG